MKVCIPCTDATVEQARLFIPYGQAPFFALWDAATDRLEFQSNPLAGQDHACACAATRWMQRLEASVLITADIGRRAAQRLTEAGVEVLHAPIGDLGELLTWYRQGGLVPAPAGEPHGLQRRVDHAERPSQLRAAHRHGGQGRCCGEHEGRHEPEPQGQEGPRRHGEPGRCCGGRDGRHGLEPQAQEGPRRHGGQGHQCCGERQGRPVQGQRGRGGHGDGCRHSV